MPTIRQITMARNSFKNMSAQRPDVFIGVYEQLSSALPESDRHYNDSLYERAVTLDGIIALALLSLDHPPALYGSLHRLRRQYAHYGSWKDNYPILIELMVDSFAKASAEDWSLELAEAWRDVLELIAVRMLEGVTSQHVA